MKPLKLIAKHHAGAGWKIEGLIPKTINCAEFTLKASFQPIVEMHDDVLKSLIGYEPFIQFSPKEWDDMIAETFTEMVDLWNAKNAPQKSMEGVAVQQATAKGMQAEEPPATV